MDDPWDWDVDRVVHELCTPDSRWYSQSGPVRLPPFDQLTRALHENEVDGEVLLTYEQSELCTELGVKILKHKSIFKNAIREIRLQSTKYRLWLKKERASEFGEDLEDLHKESRSLHVNGTSINDTVSPPATASHDLKPTDDVATSDKNFLPPSVDASSSQKKSKRRIAPTMITTEVDPNRNRTITTQADVISSAWDIPDQARQAGAISSSNSYLGNKSVTRFDISESFQSADSERLTQDDKEINFVSSTQLYPGRLRQTHRIMQHRLLRQNGYVRSSLNKMDMIPGTNDPEYDKVLPLYGESDDDMEYDAVTWKEIEAERKENEKKKSTAKSLSADEIDAIVSQKIDDLVFQWEKEKLPKHASKAYKLWNDARKSGLKATIDVVRSDIEVLETRISKLRKQYQMEWKSAEELQSKLVNLEPSVLDKAHRSWLLSILTNPTEPPKISRPQIIKHKAPQEQSTLEEDEEILTSESEDDLADFIVDDDLSAPAYPDSVSDRGYPMDLDQEASVDDIAHSNGGFELSEEKDAEETDRADIDMDISESDSSPSPVKSIPSSSTSQPLVIDAEPKTPSSRKLTAVVDLTTPPAYKLHYKAGKLTSSKTPVTAKKTPTTSSSLIIQIDDLVPSKQKVAIAVSKLDQLYINTMFSIARNTSPEEIWLDLVMVALQNPIPKAPFNRDHAIKDRFVGWTLLGLFETYQDDTARKLGWYKGLNEESRKNRWGPFTQVPEQWDDFMEFFMKLADRFEWKETKYAEKMSAGAATSTSTPEATKKKIENGGETMLSSDNTDAETDVDSDENRNPLAEGGPNSRSPKKTRRRRPVQRDKSAARFREIDQAGAAEGERRRQHLRAKMDALGSDGVGSQQGSIIINETKADDESFIYINPKIATEIKEHQVAGVRFMWDQVINAKTRQGCLLAHTMGLGKTMQIVTLLVAINEAANSNDPTVSSQIPDELRESRTLVLCPPALVNNWFYELDERWTSKPNQMGMIRKIESLITPDARIDTLTAWADEGGVLIIGYILFKSLVEHANENHRKILLEKPNIIVADEAHVMKNPLSKLHAATANFRTRTRLALTGSPLANNVEEYFSMINWVAPNYLGGLKEFRAQYAGPIKDGLSIDSTEGERRKALKLLRVLKAEVSPKVSRITISVLKHDIPRKQEFVITVPLTPLQKAAYEMFIQYHETAANRVPVFSIHDLGLMCAHPLIFEAKLKELKEKSAQGTMVLPLQLMSDEMSLIRRASGDPSVDEQSLSYKIPILLKILEESKGLGDRVLIFSHSMHSLDYMERILRQRRFEVERLDGDTRPTKRQGMVTDFNDSRKDVFLISTRAGGLGLNITGANRVIIFDSGFNPQDEQQAVGRAYRIGQKKEVFVYRLMCGGTYEAKMLEQAIWKMQLASRVVDKKHPVPKSKRFDGAWTMPEEVVQRTDLFTYKGKDCILDLLLGDEPYHQSILAVEMMDTFEEETMEEVELSAEDRQEADKMVEANEARRSGRPLPDSAVGSTNGNISSGLQLQNTLGGTWRSSAAPQAVSSFAPAMVRQGVPSSTAPISSHLSLSLPQPQIYQAQAPVQVPRLDRTPNLAPNPALNQMSVQAEVPSRLHDGTSFMSEIDRLFTINSGFPDEKTRKEVAKTTATALIQSLNRDKTIDHQRDVESAVMNAASHERFIEALCMNMIPLEQLAEMSAQEIDHQLKMWKSIDGTEWQAKKSSWTSSDPNHLGQALNRMGSTPRGIENDQRASGPHRTADREAMQAVADARKSKTKSLDDQQAFKGMLQRRSAKQQQPPPAGENQAGRLPPWAKDAVRQSLAKSVTPASSTPPEASATAEKVVRVPQARTPFKS
ncbi:hypothetical protein F5Y16DRAFT_405056 [Xylariaceae sp. FL0255]|nr:hypothetical protein F5Y16DRAFT_405056 [Xylariaceae sp. FL0255]